jgi:hypothetical protein
MKTKQEKKELKEDNEIRKEFRTLNREGEKEMVNLLLKEMRNNKFFCEKNHNTTIRR